ncbi:MAG: 3-phosphoserine/phosphohydroxythreonine transaminase [Clostridia bacterium]|nr:3-phosphoserine/phosphohydroxythreonine transaminase [Clostridia bacterium]
MRVYNFSAGPANLPLEVLETAQKELVEYGTAGMSVMEMSHRSADFKQIIEDAEKLLRKLMNIPDNYKVLFLQGGASMQFAMVPLNLKKNGKADFINTGAWSKKAIKESKKVLDVNVLASSEDKTFSYIPEIDESKLQSDADFLHITQNNTIYGTRYTSLPNAGSVPIVADMSSCILSEEFDVTKYGIIYAGAQKNIGPAGVTIVIIREDLIGNAPESVPTMLNYETHSEAGSMFNTPPTFAIYIAKLVFEWVDKQGGVKALQKINEEKAKMLYDYIDSSKMFSNPVAVKDRSIMNVTFVTGNEDLDAKFVKEAKAQGLCNLKGHRSVGGMRASIYNAMPVAGVEKLIAFMKEFEANN